MLLCIIILIAYIVIAEFLEIKRIDFLHESGVAVFLGVFAGIIIYYIFDKTIAFDESSLFYFILPPIIFSAGYTLKHQSFLANFSYIVSFGLFGTLISMAIMSYFVISINSFLFSDQQYSKFKLTDYEWLILWAILCASDTVAALTLVKPNSILFGEGIVNDAVSILLFRSIEDLIVASKQFIPNSPDKPAGGDIGHNLRNLAGNEFSLLSSDSLKILSAFWFISLLSVLIGVGFGLLASFIFKKIPTLKVHPSREVFLIMLIAYLSYVVSEMIHLSGIMTIFWWGMTMSYYTIYNLSNKSRKGSQLSVQTIGSAAEAFLFAYMGLSLFGISANSISLSFSFSILVISIIARAFSIIIPYLFLCKIMKFAESIPFNQLLLLWFSGIIKGAIAFGLSMQIQSSITSKKSVICSTTLSIVLFTTIILGGSMSFFAKLVGLSKENEMIKRMYASFGKDAGKKRDFETVRNF